MNPYVFTMALTVLSNVGYHLSQRAISRDVDPLVSLAITYVVALATTVAALPFFSGREALSWSAYGKANWASYALGVTAVGLELGFLLAYRAGWRVSLAAIVSNTWVALLLIPVGLLFFREAMDLRRASGIVLAVAGLWLLGKE